MSTPAGWYPDPAEPSQARWWDGSGWTGQTAPRSAVAGLGEPVPAPRYGEYAPVPPVASPFTSEQTPASAGLPAWPSAAPSVAATAPQKPGLDTNTPWIWLSIIVAHLQILTLFFVDWTGYIDATLLMESDPTAGAAAVTEWTAGIAGISLLGYVSVAAAIVFAWLDYRALAARGIQKPFHWAFAFFVLLITIGVYVIGRTVVVRRQTGKGLAPLWGWIAVTVLVIVITVGFMVSLVGQLLAAIPV